MSDGKLSVTVNGEARQFPEGTTLGDLLESLALAVEGVAVAINLEVVPRGGIASRALRQGDRVELVRAVGGG